MSWLGPLMQAGASILGNVMGASSSRSAASQARRQAELDRQTQLDIAKNQIQWRTADAKRAGIHPLYALGMSPINYSPVAIGGGSGGGEYYSQMGQDIGRAVGAYQSNRERRQALQMEQFRNNVRAYREGILFDQQVERNSLENDRLRSQIARLNAPGSPPGLDFGPGAVEVLPARSTSPGHNGLAREAGSIRDFGFTNTDGGGLSPVPSDDIHERIEENIPAQVGHFYRNNILPIFNRGMRHAPDPREHPLPRGFDRWRWNNDVQYQAFYPYDSRTHTYLIRGRRVPARGPQKDIYRRR